MTLSRIGRLVLALVVAGAMGLGMAACGSGTVGYMWVLGTQYNQVFGFKIDNYTGNLTSAVGSPFSSGGTNPVSVVVKPGGRWLYVVNEGVPAASDDPTVQPGTDGNIAVYSVGGDGTLTYQATYSSQGKTPVWAAVDSTGGFLYVLDQRSPAYGTKDANGNVDLNGDITVFAIANDTGRLSLVTNAQVKNSNGTQLSYFEVGPHPIMTRVSSSGCLLTVDQADHTVFPYTVGTAGQLTLTTNSKIVISSGSSNPAAPAPQLTSISTSGSAVYLTDAANNFILPYTVGSGCTLNTQVGGSVANLARTANPVYTFADSKNKWLYVLNQSSTDTTAPNSSISIFTILPSNGQLQAVGDPSNPSPVGAGPVCMEQDPTSQYVYTSNHDAGTITGKILNQSQGLLSPLKRGTTFPGPGQATCMVISGNVS